MDRGARWFFAALALVAALGCWCLVGTVWWPGYFGAMWLHLAVGLALVPVSVPVLAVHVRRTGTRVGPVLMLPAAVLALVGWLLPGRPDYPAFGPIGWSLWATAALLVAVAGSSRLVRRELDRPAPTTSWSGSALMVATIFVLATGVFGWQLRGDERWGAMAAHSLVGGATAVLLLLHLRTVRAAIARSRWIAAVLVPVGLALVIGWGRAYPHPLLLADVHSPMGFGYDPEQGGDAEQVGEDSPYDIDDFLSEHDPLALLWGDSQPRSGLRVSIPSTAAGWGSADTPTISEDVLTGSMACGDSGCHELLTRQWAGSAHRFAADNDLYLKAVALVVSELGTKGASLCAGCHDPVRVLAGTVEEAYATGKPPPGEGVSCVVCHIADRVPLPPANGIITYREPRGYPGSKERRHANIRLDPRRHRDELSTNYRVADPNPTCAACHRVALSPDIGAASTVELQSAIDPAVFAEESETRLGCPDCHMPTLTVKRAFEQGLYDHHWSGVNLDLMQYVRHPDADPDALDLVKKNTAAFLSGRLDLRGLEGTSSSHEIANEARTVLREGHALQLELEVGRTADGGLQVRAVTRNHRAGHAFPIGPFDLQEVWQTVQVRDSNGALLWSVGELDDRLRLGEDPHRLGAVEIGIDGLPLRHHRIWEITEIREKRQIARGGSVEDTYEIALPVGADGGPVPGPLQVRVGWQARRVNQDFADWVYDGDGTTFPVHELASAEASVP